MGDRTGLSKVARLDDLVVDDDVASGRPTLDEEMSYPLHFRRNAGGRWFVDPAGKDLLDLVDGRLGWRL